MGNLLSGRGVPTETLEWPTPQEIAYERSYWSHPPAKELKGTWPSAYACLVQHESANKENSKEGGVVSDQDAAKWLVLLNRERAANVGATLVNQYNGFTRGVYGYSNTLSDIFVAGRWTHQLALVFYCTLPTRCRGASSEIGFNLKAMFSSLG